MSDVPSAVLPAHAAPLFRDLFELTKPRITGMVVVAAAVGVLAAPVSLPSWERWVHTLLGTALVAAASGALNQVFERDADGRMRRTAGRPIPAGRLSADAGLALGVALAVVGLLELSFGVNLLAAFLAAATLASYLFVYTPLKRVSGLSTLVGAVPGAVPPLIGWAAARGTLDLGAWSLFALLYLWQLPHFLAIAWIYRADYARGGFPLLSVEDPDGTRTARQALLYCAALVPVSLLPTALGMAAVWYFSVTLAVGLLFLYGCARFALRRNLANARLVLRISVLYQPVVLLALGAERLLA